MTAQTIDFQKLSPEYRKELKRQLAAEEKSDREKRKADIATYKELQKLFVETYIGFFVEYQTNVEEMIERVITSFQTQLLPLKSEIYGVKVEDQDTHTMSDPEGKSSLYFGRNVNITFDGTEDAGVQIITDYITGLSGDETDEKAQKLAKVVRFLLKPNVKTKMLNPSRIIQLNQMRSEFNSPEFDNGMDIIYSAQNRTISSTFVGGWLLIEKSPGLFKKVEFRFSA